MDKEKYCLFQPRCPQTQGHEVTLEEYNDYAFRKDLLLPQYKECKCIVCEKDKVKDKSNEVIEVKYEISTREINKVTENENGMLLNAKTCLTFIIGKRTEYILCDDCKEKHPILASYLI